MGTRCGGHPTTDPVRAKAGAIAPFGDAKGYGLGIAMELLVAALAGSALAPDVRGTLDSQSPCNKGDVFILIEPSLAPGLPARLSAYLDAVRASPPAGPANRSSFRAIVPAGGGRRQAATESISTSASGKTSTRFPAPAFWPSKDKDHVWKAAFATRFGISASAGRRFVSMDRRLAARASGGDVQWHRSSPARHAGRSPLPWQLQECRGDPALALQSFNQKARLFSASRRSPQPETSAGQSGTVQRRRRRLLQGRLAARLSEGAPLDCSSRPHCVATRAKVRSSRIEGHRADGGEISQLKARNDVQRIVSQI